MLSNCKKYINELKSMLSSTSQNELAGIAAKYITQKWLFLQTKLLVYLCIYMAKCMSASLHKLRATL